jgi:hypothetical protein
MRRASKLLATSPRTRDERQRKVLTVKGQLITRSAIPIETVAAMGYR